MHYVSNKPSFDEVEGYVDVSFGRFDTDADANRSTVEFAVGGPLSDTLAARLALRYNKQDGYLKNLYPDSAFLGSPGAGAGADLGDDDTLAGRLTFSFRPNDDLQFDLSINTASSDVATGPYQSKSTIGVVENGELINVIDTPPGETRLTIDTAGGDAGGDAIDGDQLLPGGGIGLPGRLAPGGDFFGYLDPDGDDFTFSSDFAFEDQGSTETDGINLRVEWQLSDNLAFTSVTDFKDYEKLLFIDVDAAPANQLANYAGVDATSFTQEFRFSGESGRMNWVAGFFYLNIDNESDNGLKAPANSIAGSPPFAPVDIGVVSGLETDSYSLFGQVDYELSDTLSLTVGGRVIREEKDFNTAIGVFPSFDNFSVNRGDFIPNAFGAGSPYFFATDTSDTLWAGKIQLDYRPNDDWLWYIGLNRGVKAGSFNAPLLGAYLGAGGNSALPYDEEILHSLEGGFKATLGDGRTRVNGSVFYYDYSDYQAFLFVGVGGVVINADAENYGVEFDVQTSPMDGLDMLFSLSYFDATVKDILLRNGSPLPPRDVDPTYAPEFQATGLVRYEWPALGGYLAVQGDVSYSDEYSYNLRNFDADKFDSYVMLNTQLSWRNESDSLVATLAIRNLTDERAGIQGFDLATLCGCNEVSYRAPRFYSVGLRYNF